LLPSEAERCAVTGKLAAPGLLATCAASGKRVLPAQLGTCSVSGKKALTQFLVSSSISDARMLEGEAIRSLGGACCMPSEAKRCSWSGKLYHPDDLRKCALTGVPIYVGFLALEGGAPRLEVLSNMLSGTEKADDQKENWLKIAEFGARRHHGKWHVESVRAGPDGHHLAVCAEIRTWLGLRSEYAGLLYSLDSKDIVGHIALGKRKDRQWVSSP